MVRKEGLRLRCLRARARFGGFGGFQGVRGGISSCNCRIHGIVVVADARCTNWCADGDCGIDRLVEGDENLSGGGVEGRDYGGAGEEVGVC